MDDEIKRAYLEADQYAQKRLEDGARRSGVDGEIGKAALFARECVRGDELEPTRTEFGEFKYTAHQGRKASAHAREDAAAIFHMQGSILRRLQQLKLLAIGCIVLLIYIAIRVT